MSANESIEDTTKAIVGAPPAADPIDQTKTVALEKTAAAAEEHSLPLPPALEQGKREEEKEAEVKAKAQQLQLVPLMVVPKMTLNYSSNSLVEVPLHESSDEEEHADSLSPLMMDNHTVVEHLECYQSNSPTHDLPAPMMVVDIAGNITIMKHSDTKDSLSSLDSDMCMSFDMHGQPTTPTDDSQGNSSSDNDPARDSGCESGPCGPARPYCPVEADEGVEANGDDEDLHDDGRPFEIPNEEFSERIVEQVEFYFSNESILKDAFLLKHVRRNKEGFVSLKLVSSFKRVRQLTKDWRVVGHAIQLKSKTVQLNDVGTKVRRTDPLPNYDETMPSRTVVATDMPAEKITIEKAYELFSKCGEIALVRILRVGGPIPADVRQFINKYPELLQKECALVEFVESRSARNALACEGITVLEMVAPKKKTGKKATVTRIVENHPQPSASLMMFSGSSGMDLERSRGGAPLENNTPPRFQIRRVASGCYAKPDQVIYVPPPRKFGYNHGQGKSFAFNNNPTPAVGPRYVANAPPAGHHPHQSPPNHQPQYQYQPIQPHHHHHHQHQQTNAPHFHSPQSTPPTDTYEVYRRTSAGHIVAVTSSPTNNFHSEEMRRGSLPLTDMMPRKMHGPPPMHLTSPPPVYECQCNCQATPQQPRRMSSGGSEVMFRRVSTQNGPSGVESPRKLSNASSGAFERKASVTETNWRNETAPMERKYSTEYHHQHYQSESPIRKFSNGFDPLRKLSSATDEYVNGRRISTDSGYDRKYSFSSDCSATARSRSSSFICNHAPVIEQIVRAPTGPANDGSRGFGSRTRKIGQILPPI